jgi:short-subunit dehydrogenase
MKEVALITGASGGIGYEIALLFAKNKIDVVLVARNEQKLWGIKSSIEGLHGVNVHVVATDLSRKEGVEETCRYVRDNGLMVAYLVNNAGFGYYGNFIDGSMDRYHEIIDLNMASLTALSHHFASEMVKNGKGRILNVSSTAGFQPAPFFAVYGATKAYVTSLTEALHKELEDTGVTVTVLSPGPTRTDFMDRAEMHDSKLFQSGVMTAAEVAEVGYRGMMKGRLHVVPGFKNRVVAFFSSITPSSKLRLDISAKVMGRKRPG